MKWPWKTETAQSDDEVQFRVIKTNESEVDSKGRPLKNTNRVRNSKYTKWTFLPKNLMEQFRRPMNQYFLLISCLQLIRAITPVNPLSSWLPLIFIVLISAVKELLDDIKRHKFDNEVNNRVYSVTKNGVTAEVRSKDIGLGDMVYLESEDQCPCDLVLLSSSDPKGCAFVQTSNLDGEIDLKLKRAPKETQALNIAELTGLKGLVVCAEPNAEIYRFDSQLFLTTDQHSYSPIALSDANVLLQGTLVRNVDYVYGMAVYTGDDTKLSMNKKVPEEKSTALDALIDRCVAAIFISQLCIAAVLGGLGLWQQMSDQEDMWYLGGRGSHEMNWYDFLVVPLRMLLLMSLMIPISLKVTLDVCKFMYAQWIGWDLDMYDDQSDQPAVATSAAVAEDLGQIQYIFSDKTGTLTENVMSFKACCVGKVRYGGKQPQTVTPEAMSASVQEDYLELRQAVRNTDTPTIDFFRIIALCNDIMPRVLPKDPTYTQRYIHRRGSLLETQGSAQTDNLIYEGASPDEEALVDASRWLGVTMLSRTDDTVEVQVNDVKERWSILHTLPFDPQRKRVSVLVQQSGDARGEVRVLTKGADDVMMARSTTGDVNDIAESIEIFAQIGLRTLCMSHKTINYNEYKTWCDKLLAAEKLVQDRDKATAKCYEEMEQGLHMVGASAIEDKLQDDVANTISGFRDANIKVWMVTGDKHSTARQIAGSCKLIRPTDLVLPLVELANDAHIDRTLAEYELIVLQTLAINENNRSNRRNVIVDIYGNDLPAMQSGSSLQGSSDIGLDESHMGANEHKPMRSTTDFTYGDGPEIATYGATLNERDGTLADMQHGHSSHEGGYSIIIDGKTLDVVLTKYRTRLSGILEHATSVVACRMTPLQKSEIVRLMNEKGYRTLAVGDGGNDVSMIQTAHVGVAIYGKEGLQAARASDYSIAKFKFLRRLLFVHGHYSYQRSAFVILYSFHKSVFIVAIQICFQFYCQFSGSSFFDSLQLTLWNVAFTGLPIMLYMFDRRHKQRALMTQPWLYRTTQDGSPYTYKLFVYWMVRAVAQGLFCFYCCTLALGYTAIDTQQGGLILGQDGLAMVCYANAIMIQAMNLGLQTHSFTWMNHVVIWGLTPMVWVVFGAATLFPMFGDYPLFFEVQDTWIFWILMPLVLVGSLVPFVGFEQLFMPQAVALSKKMNSVLHVS